MIGGVGVDNGATPVGIGIEGKIAAGRLVGITDGRLLGSGVEIGAGFSAMEEGIAIETGTPAGSGKPIGGRLFFPNLALIILKCISSRLSGSANVPILSSSPPAELL